MAEWKLPDELIGRANDVPYTQCGECLGDGKIIAGTAIGGVGDGLTMIRCEDCEGRGNIPPGFGDQLRAVLACGTCKGSKQEGYMDDGGGMGVDYAQLDVRPCRACHGMGLAGIEWFCEWEMVNDLDGRLLHHPCLPDSPHHFSKGWRWDGEPPICRMRLMIDLERNE